VVASAYIRHAQTDVHLARVAHRLAATGVLALVIGMLLLAWTQRPVWRREGTFALAALAIALALAVLGLVTPGARLPAITAGNLLGGYAMLAVLVAAWASVEGGQSPPAARWFAGAGLALVFIETFLGWARFDAAHILVAIAVAALAAIVAWRLRSARPRLAAGIVVLLAIGSALGFALEAPGTAVAVAVAHNALAAGLAALLTATTTR
jgi:cytochrome c oxidase assembly protein subunit 15